MSLEKKKTKTAYQAGNGRKKIPLSMDKEQGKIMLSDLSDEIDKALRYYSIELFELKKPFRDNRIYLGWYLLRSYKLSTSVFEDSLFQFRFQ